MKTIAGGLILAVVLFAAGALCQAESRHTRRLADAQLRLATLKLADEADLDDDVTVIEKMPAPIGLPANTESRHAATVSYWLARYTSLTDMTSALKGPAPDPAVMLLSANAAFRTSAPGSADKKAVVARLDNVIQAYADVMRRDPSLTDAAFNFEYVTRLRDAAAKAASSKTPPKDAKKGPAAPPDVSVDLPTGPTIHGAPGGPPEGTAMSDFKTVTPMRYDEREEQMDPGLGKKIQRKG